ncbi:hypothetical protein MMC13_000118 [Lambiella insularis]|nr:hypothetical protein [Lambiella insularis]
MLTSLSISLLLLSLPLLLRAEFDFHNYPLCVQSVLYTFAPATCDYGDASDAETEATDHCLCTSLGFLNDAATHIFPACGCADLQTAAQVVSNNCAKYQTNAALSVDDFIVAGSATCGAGKGPLDAGAIVEVVFGVLSVVPIGLGFLQLLVALGAIQQSSSAVAAHSGRSKEAVLVWVRGLGGGGFGTWHFWRGVL